MLSTRVDDDRGIAYMEPDGPLSEIDFEQAARVVNPYIEQHGTLAGVIIHTQWFPGWESFAAMCSHLRFVKAHHRQIGRVALVTDSRLGRLVEPIADHFVAAEIEVFSYDEMGTAADWILS